MNAKTCFKRHKGPYIKILTQPSKWSAQINKSSQSNKKVALRKKAEIDNCRGYYYSVSKSTHPLLDILQQLIEMPKNAPVCPNAKAIHYLAYTFQLRHILKYWVIDKRKMTDENVLEDCSNFGIFLP